MLKYDKKVKINYDTSRKAISIDNFRHYLMLQYSDFQVIWNAIVEGVIYLCNRRHNALTDYDETRFRFHLENDPVLMKNKKVQMLEVFYRVTDTNPNQPEHPHSPWPDQKLGELYLTYDDSGQVIGVVENIPEDITDNLKTNAWSITDIAKFPRTLEEAQRLIRDYMYLPGTNLPAEEFSEGKYWELMQTVPRQMVF